MKKWFLAACLPLMIVSCDIFGLGDDGDDDDTMIVDPPMANVSFDYEDKILSGDTFYDLCASCRSGSSFQQYADGNRGDR